MKLSNNVIIGLCYRPPHIKNSDFLDRLDELLATLHRENAHIYIVGDFNYNTLNLSHASNNIANDFQNIFHSHAYYPLIDKPTREENNTFTLIDNIYSNIPQHSTICRTAILKSKPKLSDHHPIICFTNYKYTVMNNTYIFRRDFSKKQTAKFDKKLKYQSWEYIYNISAQQMYSYFQNQIHICLKSVFLKNM